MRYTAELGTFFQVYEGTYIPAGKAYLEIPRTTASLVHDRPIRIVVREEIGTDLEYVKDSRTWKKEVRNGKLYIIYGEKTYTIDGSLIK